LLEEKKKTPPKIKQSKENTDQITEEEAPPVED